MAKVWSFNTTVRNPERVEQMLRALSELQGTDFDAKGQESFFRLQIKKRLYKPSKKTLGEADLIAAVHTTEVADDLSDEIVDRIISKYNGRKVDGAGRGRTSAAVLNRFGLGIALQSKGQIIITHHAQKWLDHEIDDTDLFTKFLLKWQYPNPIELGYNEFNIKPFIGTLALIDTVNKKWSLLGNKPVGISKEEYRLFVPSLTDASLIEKYSDRILWYRTEKRLKKDIDLSNFIKRFAEQRVLEIFGETKKIKTYLRDLHDYADSSLRYFRMSGLVTLRGSDRYVDIVQDKQVEVSSLLRTIPAHSTNFDSFESYLAFLSNIDVPSLPWENETDSKKISEQLLGILRSEIDEKNYTEYSIKADALPLLKRADFLNEILNDVRIQKLRNLRHDIGVIDECIAKLKDITSRNYETVTARPSLDLEWYVSRALMVLNDAIFIQPSFKLGDDGIPTGFRPNVSDIECQYVTFGMTIEVTLLLGRDQWVAEGQPVMRHLRDFEDKYNKLKTICLFIAPLIHRDTLNIFWNSNRFEFEGRKQKIIPVTIEQFVTILVIARDKIQKKTLSHEDLERLWVSFFEVMENVGSSQEWIREFPGIIKKWS